MSLTPSQAHDDKQETRIKYELFSLEDYDHILNLV